jgi:tetratricopeptide (TPR) repeat protein
MIQGCGEIKFSFLRVSFDSARIPIAILLLSVLFVAGCSSENEKKAVYFEKGKSYFDNGDFNSAELEFKNAVQIDPDFTEARYMLGMVSLKLAKFEQAYRNFSNAINLSPDHLDAQLQMGKLFLAAKKTSAALEKSELVLKSDPLNEEALLLKGSALLADKNTSDCIKFFEETLNKGFQKPTAYLMLHLAYITDKDSQNAESTLVRGIETNPDAVLLHKALAQYYLRNNNGTKAELFLRRIIELEPDVIANKLMLASLIWDLGRKKEATDMVEGILSSNPGREDVIIMAARFHMGKRQFTSVEKILQNGISNNEKSTKLCVALGKFYQVTGRIKTSIHTLERCLATDQFEDVPPEMIAGKNALARIYMTIGQLDKSLELTEKALKADPENIESHLLKGQVQLLRGETLDAISEFELVSKKNPALSSGYNGLSKAHLQNGDRISAESAIWKGLVTNPKSRVLLQLYYRILMMSRKYKEAEIQLRKHLDEYPNDFRIRMDLGDLLLVSKDFQGAQQAYEYIKNKAPGNPSGYLRLGRLYTIQENMKMAIYELEEGYRTNPNSSSILTALVRLYLKEGRYDEAVDACRSLLKQNPNNPFAYNLLGEVYRSRKDTTKARSAYLKAIDIDPEWLPPHRNMLQLELSKGKKTQIIKNLSAEIRNAPKKATGYILLAQIHEISGDIQKAIEIYEQALKENPDMWIAANNLAFHLSEPIEETQDLKKARELVLKALEIKPGYVDALDTLGWIYYQSGDLNKAFGLIESAVSKKPNHPVINYHLGMVLHAKERYKEAEIALRKALSQQGYYLGKREAEKTLKLVLALKTDKEHKGTSDVSGEDLAKEIITGEEMPGAMEAEDSKLGGEFVEDIFENLYKKDQANDSRSFTLPGKQ